MNPDSLISITRQTTFRTQFARSTPYCDRQAVEALLKSEINENVFGCGTCNGIELALNDEGVSPGIVHALAKCLCGRRLAAFCVNADTNALAYISAVTTEVPVE